jgi:hypothetical protein
MQLVFWTLPGGCSLNGCVAIHKEHACFKEEPGKT